MIISQPVEQMRTWMPYFFYSRWRTVGIRRESHLSTQERQDEQKPVESEEGDGVKGSWFGSGHHATWPDKPMSLIYSVISLLVKGGASLTVLFAVSQILKQQNFPEIGIEKERDPNCEIVKYLKIWWIFYLQSFDNASTLKVNLICRVKGLAALVPLTYNFYAHNYRYL